MKKYGFIAAACLSMILGTACGKAEKEIDSKWRVTDKEEYKPRINEATLYTSLDEFEKILLAPFSYFEETAKAKSFSTKNIWTTVSKQENEEKIIELQEKTACAGDGKGNFKLAYINDKNEGWDIIWLDSFIYRRMLGGEYMRGYSQGEHTYYRESLFSTIPQVYQIFREHASLKKAKDSFANNIPCKQVAITFSDDKQQRSELPKKRYLQNMYGIEEITNDQLIKTLAQKKKSMIKGELNACVADDFRVVKLEMTISFTLPEDNLSITLAGERSVHTNQTETIETPKFLKEYHRRNLDATRNLLNPENPKVKGSTKEGGK